MPMNIEIPVQIQGSLSTVGVWDVLDIFIVAVIIYKIYEMLQDTRAITLVKGLLVLMVVTFVCKGMQLHVMTWLLQNAVQLLFVALPIVFQPELRRALEHLGQGKFLRSSGYLDDNAARSVVNELAEAVDRLAADKTGALIVIERDMGLNDISDTGVQINGVISKEFLLNVFIPNTPLHDGAAVVRGNRLIAAGCLLPLTENRGLSTELGTRHRAAIGLSEQCDALILVVSEETGTISIAENGHIMRHVDMDTLRAVLRPAFITPNLSLKDMFNNWRNGK